MVKGNRIQDLVSAYATSGGIYVDGGKSIIIENNITSHNGYGCENVSKTASNITVRNNLFYDNEVSGIALGGYDYPSGSGKVTDVIVTHNTFFRNDYSGSFTGELYLTYTENCSISNNIISTSSQNLAAFNEASSVNLELDYNLYYCPGGDSALMFDWNGNGYTGLGSYHAAQRSTMVSVFGRQAPCTFTSVISIADSDGEPLSKALTSVNRSFSMVMPLAYSQRALSSIADRPGRLKVEAVSPR